MWLAREYPGVAFERYCDDAVIHCTSREQAVMIRDALAGRLAEVGLELHPDKTRVVYCKDADRRGDHEVTSFTYLGYTFRPRNAPNRWGTSTFMSFLPAVSKDALKRMSQEVRSWRIARRSASPSPTLHSVQPHRARFSGGRQPVAVTLPRRDM